MRVDIKTSGLDLTEGLREHTERRLGFALDRAHHDLNTITVRLSDINGPRGGADKRCQIQIPLPRHNRTCLNKRANRQRHAPMTIVDCRKSR